MADHNFIHASLPKSDRRLFFPGETEFRIFDGDCFSLSDMAVSIGLFTSKTQAHKNGWSREPLPPGFGYKRARKK